jgi:hypothetical protein
MLHLSPIATMDRLCAEVVLSFGTNTVVPAMVAPPLPALLTKWVVTLHPLLNIIGPALHKLYVDLHIPVFSTSELGHFTLVSKSSTVVGGRRIRCDRCPTDNLSATTTSIGKKAMWTITCRGCHRYVEYPHQEGILDADRRFIFAVPDNNDYLCTPYPILNSNLEWKDAENEAQRSMAPGPSVAPPMERQTSAKRGRQDSDPPSQQTMPGSLGVVTSKSLQKKRSRTCRLSLSSILLHEDCCSLLTRAVVSLLPSHALRHASVFASQSARYSTSTYK